jgi:NDP-sugar pyrophosphorylase family protein
MRVLREALILAGGLGTRLRSVVADRPKPMADVKGRPFITHILDQLVHARVERAILCLGHLGEYVPPVLGERYGPLALVYSFETIPLGTGGALRHAQPLLTDDTFFVLNGDSLCEVDLAALAAAHGRTGAEMTLVSLHRDDRSRAGALTLDVDNRVTQFESRPAAPTPGPINAGIYVMHRDVLGLIPAGRAVSLEDEIMPLLVARRSLYAWPVDGGFVDIGTPESYLAMRGS